jgi:hypothetical protein
VQAVISVYSEFKRADGHVVWMHDDQWEGQHWNTGPGSLCSDAQKAHLDPHQGYAIKLSASNVIPPVKVPPDDQWVRRIKFQSPSLTKFWGRPIYLGATVLVPRDYDKSTIRLQHPSPYFDDSYLVNSPSQGPYDDALMNELIPAIEKQFRVIREP